MDQDKPKINTDFFDRIQKMFSTDVVMHSNKDGQLKVVDINNIQKNGELATNSLYDKYNKVYTTSGRNAYSNINSLPTSRIQLYTDYEAMDTDAIIASALDIIADEVGLKNDFGEILQIRSSDDTVQKLLYNLFYDVINIEYNLWSWTRSMCKYGDFYLKLEISEKFGVYNVIPFSSYTMIRTEGEDPLNPQAVKFTYDPTFSSQQSPLGHQQLMAGAGSQKIEFQNYEISHFRLLSDYNYLPYGRCLSPDSRIYTENNIKKIKDIVKGDKVWTFNIDENKYELSDVLATVNSGIKKIFKIKTVHNELKGSDNHPLLVWDFKLEKPDYKQIKDLKKGDYLCAYKKANIKLSNPALNKNIFELGPHDWKCDLTCLDSFPDTVTPEFARFWGFMLGDGWQNKHTFGFARGINDERNLYYENLLKKYSNKDKLNLLYSKTSKVVNSGVTVSSKLFHHLMTINGYVGKSYSKRLPSWIFECDEETQLSLVKGLMDADGYIFTDKWDCNSYNLTLNNKELLIDLKTLLDRAKIKTGTIRSRKWNGKCNILGKEYNAKQAYDFTFYLDGKRKEQYNKYNLINSKYNVELFKIKSITEELPEETYDIQVSKNSNFISDGLIVHNSSLEPARKIFKQLNLLEDAMLIHRIVRAPEKRTFFINVGNIPPNEVEQYMQKTINKMKKTPYMDPKTGEYNLKYNVQNILEDFYIPVRGGDTSTKIETTKGLDYVAIDDVNYLKEKLFAALRVPKAYLGFEKDLSGKSTLAAEDIRFARTVERIQRIIVSELTRIAIVHLYAQGYEGESLTNFTLSLTPPSIIYDQERIALLKEKTDLANSMIDNKLLPSDWIYDHIFNFSQNQYEEYRDLIVEDKKRQFRWAQIESEGNDPYESGEAFGTPHSLAALNGGGRGTGGVPKGYDERSTEVPDAVLGRPVEKASIIGTQDSALGKDRMGSYQMKYDNTDGDDINPITKQGALRLEATQSVFKQNEKELKQIFKRPIKLYEESNLLDPSNILTEDKLL